MTVNQQYEELELRLDQLKNEWNSEVEWNESLSSVANGSVEEGPLIPQMDLQIPLNQYQCFINQLLELLCEHQPGLESDAGKISQTLDGETVAQWFDSAVRLNSYYFAHFAEKNQIASWLPHFLAEQAARPFLKAVAVATKEKLDQLPHHGCAACGEPARLAVISKKGKKELVCPRCEYAWEEKKISCAHCGTEDHEKLEILKLEGQESSEIHVCHSCNGYTKVIDVRKMFKKESPQLLDAKSIHLDYIAQEKGFGVGMEPISN